MLGVSLSAAIAANLGLPAFSLAEAPTGRYTLTSKIVYDSRTNLTWQRSLDGTTYEWDQAKSHCLMLGAGYDGAVWRLPTIKELMTIVDFSLGNPAIDPNAFPSTPAALFWSATPHPSTSSYALYVDFTDGRGYRTQATTKLNVRCVR